MSSIIEDFGSIGAELSKLERASAPRPDATATGDVTDEARKTFWAMYGFGYQGDSADES